MTTEQVNHLVGNMVRLSQPGAMPRDASEERLAEICRRLHERSLVLDAEAKKAKREAQNARRWERRKELKAQRMEQQRREESLATRNELIRNRLLQGYPLPGGSKPSNVIPFRRRAR